ncbi:MAG: bifunctional 5,10-methylenetetrahydrofolate dehydrogenase/5,10-methenyltetrahydrofolate cyclohydrolase, partial [bacterium]|nr:bifunctional 5,10-methylenetetrahydrofolate dehydrogenase/5,10-methenyltetrahydrofolate cyclohydrolase [bacterium]
MVTWLGQPVADSVYERIVDSVGKLKQRGVIPGLGLLLVGNNPASEVYVRMKGKACEKFGIASKTIKLPENATEQDVTSAIHQLNRDPEIHGFIVQLPLPKHLPERKLLDCIDPNKDADCLTAVNIGRLVLGESHMLPCTPAGILSLLEFYGAPISGKHIVIIGRSQIVGRPLSILLSLKGIDATVTIAHSKTPNLRQLLSIADGVVAAIGVPEFLPTSHCKPGSWVVDVGVNRVPDSNSKGYKLTGDTKN